MVPSERPVQHRKHNLRLREPGPGLERDPVPLAAPGTVAPDLDHDHGVAGALETTAHRIRRGQRDLVLGRAAPTQDRHASRGHVVVVGVVVVVVGVEVVWVGAVNLPTTIVTVAPFFAWRPAFGVCEITVPSSV